MIRRLFRFLFRLGIIVGSAAAIYKVVQARKPSPVMPDAGDRGKLTPITAREEAASEAIPEAGAPEVTPQASWVEPNGSACPATHPVKAKMSSGIFHLPGMVAYDRTSPDRCYVDAEAAQADGLRQAKR
jgi:hypothetical protein